MLRRLGGATLILSILVFLVLKLSTAEAGTTEVRIGVLANKGKSVAVNAWQPLMYYLGKEIPEHQFVLVPLGFEELYPAVEAGEVDFIITNTGQYIELEYFYGVSRIATFRNEGTGGFYTKFGGVLFVSSDREDINTIQDFPGHKMLVADEKSFGGWLMQLREIKAQGVDPSEFAELKSAGNHEEVVLAVLKGQADIGAVRTDTLERMAEMGKLDFKRIRIINEQHTPDFPFIHSTRLYPEWPFAKAAHMDTLTARKVAIALLTLPEDFYAAKAVQSGGWTIPEDYTSAHELFRELKMGPYQHLGEIKLVDVVRKYWPVMVVSVLLLLVITIAAVWISLANRRLETALAELNATHTELEKTNNLLVESVQYARNIQRALLPDVQAVSGDVAELAVLWEPLNVVGGDYYWLGRINGKVIILVADCTGHGVPGAMVTMVLSASLDFILHEGGATDPGQILTEIDRAMRDRLRQNDPDSLTDDGLDAAVCVYDPLTKLLSFAGANLPLVYVKEDSVSLIKGDRAYLGYRTLRPKNIFTVSEIAVEPDMNFYLFTDGVTDQMGGVTKQLFGRKRLTELIASFSQQPLIEQIQMLKEHLQYYRQHEEIRDDMTLIGFRIK